MPDETTIRLLSLFFFYIGKGENCPKEERWRSQIDSARLVLDRSSTLLLTSSKAFQRYSDGDSDYKNQKNPFKISGFLSPLTLEFLFWITHNLTR